MQKGEFGEVLIKGCRLLGLFSDLVVTVYCKLPVTKPLHIASVKLLPLFPHNAPLTVAFPVFLGTCRVHFCLYEPDEFGKRLPRENQNVVCYQCYHS